MVGREEVIRAARELVLVRGIRALTTDAVAKHARISKKTLYQLFSSKDELLEAVLLSLLEDSLARVDRVLDSGLPPLAKLDLFFAELEELLSHVHLRFLGEIRYFRPGVWRRLEAERRKRLERVAEIVRHCQAEGLIRQDLDVGLWLLLLRAAVEGVMSPETLLQEGLSPQKTLKTIRQIFFEGILTQEGNLTIGEHQRRDFRKSSVRGI